MEVLPSDFIKIMTPLEGTVVGLGVCPFCHKKTLTETFESASIRFLKCCVCLKQFCKETGAN